MLLDLGNPLRGVVMPFLPCSALGRLRQTCKKMRAEGEDILEQKRVHYLIPVTVAEHLVDALMAASTGRLHAIRVGPVRVRYHVDIMRDEFKRWTVRVDLFERVIAFNWRKHRRDLSRAYVEISVHDAEERGGIRFFHDLQIRQMDYAAGPVQAMRDLGFNV